MVSGDRLLYVTDITPEISTYCQGWKEMFLSFSMPEHQTASFTLENVEVKSNFTKKRQRYS